ncbi:potassium channel subfamily K member 18-like, partial [Limulus polyphemus]|uniref:Potassium channel subfamily K member 18-like n=1 Tax=Limulus polyphemus TaxID=6850 RepID=A0ABM1C3I3_LIMPO
YGNIAPKTNWGKLVTIVYAIIGIPLMFLYLTNIGDLLAKSFKYIYGRLCRCKPNDEKRRRRHREHYRVHHIVLHDTTSNINNFIDPNFPSKFGRPRLDETKMETLPEEISEEEDYGKQRIVVPITLCLVLITGYICGGAFLFSISEGWNYLDGAYFCFVTLSTVGFGDTVVSNAESSQHKLVICSLYLLGGMALIAMCFNLVQDEVLYKLRSVGMRLGIIQEQEDIQE